MRPTPTDMKLETVSERMKKNADLKEGQSGKMRISTNFDPNHCQEPKRDRHNQYEDFNHAF